MSDASAGASLNLASRIVRATSADSSIVRAVVPQTRQQLLKNRRERFIDGLLVRVHNYLWVLWRFVGRIDSGELPDFAGTRLFVKILRIARFANFQRRIDENFDKLCVALKRNFPRATAIHS